MKKLSFLLMFLVSLGTCMAKSYWSNYSWKNPRHGFDSNAFRIVNTTDATAEDYSSYIINNSFENDLGSEWVLNSMQRQNNSVFTAKTGTYFLESWVAIGSQLGNHSLSQTLSNLPEGNYTLKANALHIQQSAAQSTTNAGNPQTGVYIYAGNSQQTVTAMNLYSLNFSVLPGQTQVEIGLKAENATGNWLCVDNFQLEYTGAITADSYKSEIRNLISVAQDYLNGGIQTSVATALQTAVNNANSALSSSNVNTLNTAFTNLQTAVDNAKQSKLLYDNLNARIEYAQKVLGWWEGESTKATAWNQLQNAVSTAQTQANNYSLTTAQINSAVTTLNSRIQAVDKKIYCSGNACGSDAELQNNDSYWSYTRSLQSKHWVIFWEKGYGDNPPAVVPGILDKADQLFEFYANDLGFITINQGSSKTDTYKMIIRLKYSTTWEASGSGIDNVIGLLTLSNGAHTSRSGQTVAHEIGHCFQYQVHCDNNNWNGWMYNWGSSTLNVFWEMCAQWQAYKFYPDMQFVWDSNQGNDWFGGTINGLHRHPLCVDLRYNNYFIQDYFCHKHGIKFLGRMWNESVNPEDPLQTYMRLTMTGTAAQKLAQLGDEMWEYGARMTTFDLDPIREKGAWRIGFRNQTTLTKDAENFWWPVKNECIENFGNNAIRLNAPSTAKKIYVEFQGKAGAEGYNSFNVNKAGWRIGFVALKQDNTRVYSDITSANYNSADKTIAFECPANCKYLWLVVSGAPTNYWTRDWLSWSEESDVEQWPYRVKFHQTNVYGQTNNNTIPDNIDDDQPTYSEQHAAGGQTYFDITNAMAPWLSTVAFNNYTNNGFKIGTWGNYIGDDGSDLTSPFIEQWVDAASGTLADISIQQTISELPNGTYYIGGSFVANNQGDENVDVTGVTFWAADKSIAVATGNGEPELYSLKVDVNDHTLTFGYKTQSTTANWIAMDNIFLYWAGTEDSYYDKATTSNPVRVVLQNPRMEEGMEGFFPGWTLQSEGNGVWNTNATAYNNFAANFMETWTASTGSLGNKSAMQNVTLREGNYTLKAAVNAVRQTDGAPAVSGVNLNLGNNSVACHTGNGQPEVYSLAATLQQGEYQLGLKLENTDANWVAWDNLILYYYGAGDDAYHIALAQCKQAAQNYEVSGNGAANAALDDFEWTDEEYQTKSSEEINKAILVLNNGAAIAANSQDATLTVKNADFTGNVQTATVQGSGGRVQYPDNWTFDYTYNGWNDTFVDSSNKLFNAWAGGISRAELHQQISNLPNGTYRLSADVRVDTPAPNSSTALYGYGNWNYVARSQEAGSEISGSTTDFANYSCAFEVVDNVADIGIRSDYSFYQIKNIKLEFIYGSDAQTQTDASYLRQDYYWNYRNVDELDLTTADAVSKYGMATDVLIYPLFPNQIIYAAGNRQFTQAQNNVVADGVCRNLVITDGQHLTITRQFTADVATYSRNMAQNVEWGTVCLPYALDSDDNVQFYVMNSVSDSWMNFTPVAHVEPNTPVVFYKLNADDTSITLSGTGNVVLTASQQNPAGTADNGWLLEGVYAETVVDNALIDGNLFYVAQNKFWQANTSTGLKVPPFRAYFHAPSNTGAKAYGLRIVDGATAISNIIDDADMQTGWYTIDGRYVGKLPEIPGIYIKNGRKVLVK